MKTVVPTTLDIARESGWSGENEPKDFVGALKLLSDHIGPASPEAVTEAVNDWLDGHPEALVADGSVTTEKLADGAVTEEKLGVDLGDAPEELEQLWDNQLTGTMSGTIDTAADAYAAPPMALSVDGASTQTGTPTPDAPVPILSVDDLSMEVHGKNLLDVCNDPENPDKGWRSSGGGTTAVQYDSANGGYYASGHRSLTVFTNTFDEPIEITLSMVAKRREGSANYAVLMYNNGALFSTSGIPSNYTSYGSAYATYAATLTANPGAFCVLVLYNQIYIQSIQCELGSTATAYEPYVGTIVPDLLPEGTDLRSLPDGTRDTLSLSYLRPSTREGWAWYSRELVTKLYEQNVSTFGQFATNSAGHPRVRANVSANARGGESYSRCNRFVYNSATYNYGVPGDYYISGGYAYFILPDTVTSATEANAWLSDHPTIILRDTTTTTTQLDPIELPQLPAQTATVWCDGGSAQPSYTMEYVQDTNIVIADLRAALADLATS